MVWCGRFDVYNSPKAVYQLSNEALEVIRSFGRYDFTSRMAAFLRKSKSLSERYAQVREIAMVPVLIAGNETIRLSPGEHSELIKSIVEDFAPRFVPGSQLIYMGDTGEKWGFFDKELAEKVGITIDAHGKMPDVVLYLAERNWLVLVEAVTSHGPVDGKRHIELKNLMKSVNAGLVFVSAFPSRSVMTRYLGDIAWESEVWLSDNPTHMIHFNGSRFVGPY